MTKEKYQAIVEIGRIDYGLGVSENPFPFDTGTLADSDAHLSRMAWLLGWTSAMAVAYQVEVRKLRADFEDFKRRLAQEKAERN